MEFKEQLKKYQTMKKKQEEETKGTSEIMLKSNENTLREPVVIPSAMSSNTKKVIKTVDPVIPEIKEAKVNEEIEMVKDDSANVVDAASKGAIDGLGLVLNIAAILLAFVALIALVNGVIGMVGGWFGITNLSLQSILGYIFAPVAVIIGVPMKEAVVAGSLIGQKIILNEFVAFTSLSEIMSTLSAKTIAVVTFSLCGFANISSIAILIGGIGGMAPSRKHDIARLGWKAVLGGTLANLLSATIAGLLLTI